MDTNVEVAQLEYHYFFLLSPSREVNDEVNKRKKLLNEIIPLANFNRYSKPHISLRQVGYKSDVDNEIIEKFDPLLRETRKFKIVLDGVDVHHHADGIKTLYIKIHNPEPINAIKHVINLQFQVPYDIPPHLTIARHISAEHFAKISDRLNEFNYSGEFNCESLTLLRRTAIGDKTSPYLKLHEIYFRS